MFMHFSAVGAAAARALSYRVAGVTITDTTFENVNQAGQVAVLWDVLNRCVVPAEQRLHAHFGSSDVPAALVKIDVAFDWTNHADASILGPLTTDYPDLVRSLRVLEVANNDFDESAALGAFAALATHLQELALYYCVLTSLRGLEGRCEYLQTVKLYSSKLSTVDALSDRVRLEQVDVSCTDITSIEPLRTCPNLVKVYVYNCPHLSSIDALADHQWLKVVDAAATTITSIESLRSCPALTTVKLNGCQQLSSIAALGTCPNLRHVDLSNCPQLPADACVAASVEVIRNEW